LLLLTALKLKVLLEVRGGVLAVSLRLMRGINSKAVYARKTKTTLTLKSRFFAKLSLKKENVFASRGCFNEAISQRAS